MQVLCPCRRGRGDSLRVGRSVRSTLHPGTMRRGNGRPLSRSLVGPRGTAGHYSSRVHVLHTVPGSRWCFVQGTSLRESGACVTHVRRRPPGGNTGRTRDGMKWNPPRREATFCQFFLASFYLLIFFGQVISDIFLKSQNNLRFSLISLQDSGTPTRRRALVRFFPYFNALTSTRSLGLL